MQFTLGRVAVAAIAVAALSGCSRSADTPGAITPVQSASATPTPTSTAADDREQDDGKQQDGQNGPGCPAGGGAVPAGADPVAVPDLDGDGELDRLWLAASGSARRLGVQTASGARIATGFTSTASTRAEAVAGRLGDGTAVILLDLGRSASLYTLADCEIVPVRNVQGGHYTFDRDLTGFGSGAGCPVIGSGRRLVGYLAKPGGNGDGYVVTRTTITFSAGGTRASNGKTTEEGNGEPGSSPVVKTAQSVTCGDSGRAVEPES